MPVSMPKELILTPKVIERFWANINKTNGCWLWTGSKANKGYGRLKTQGVTRGAHRISYAIHFGRPPLNLLVCHRCDNPLCVNPGHLFLGTFKDNVADCIAKGRKVNADGEKAGSAKLTNEQVILIRQEYAKGIETAAEIGKRFGVTDEPIRKIVRGEAWKNVAGPSGILRRKGARAGVYIGEKAFNAKLTNDQVREIRAEYRRGVAQCEIAKRFNTTAGNIHRIVNRISWKAIA